MKRRILVIDDDPAVLECLATALGDLVEADIERAATGRDGIARLRDSTFDMIFTDLILPDTTGEVVVEVARSLCPGVPVAMVTGVPEYLPTSDVWPDFIVAKPFRLSVLTKVLHDALARAPTPEAAA